MTNTTTTTVRPKEFHFPLSATWTSERQVTAQVEGKQAIEITPPPVFHGTDPSTWSPGDTRLLLRLTVRTDAGDEAQARELAQKAEETCLVSASLDLPVETMIEVKRPSTL